MKNHFVNMHLLCFLIAILCVAQAPVNGYESSIIWNLFKHVHKKQYANIEEEHYR
jgi:hypothetical protein